MVQKKQFIFNQHFIPNDKALSLLLFNLPIICNIYIYMHIHTHTHTHPNKTFSIRGH